MDAIASKTARYRWMVLAVVWTSYLMGHLTRLGIGPLAPFLKDALHLSNTQLGSLVSATGITYGPTMIVAGWLADRIGVRWTLVIGTLITGLCMIAVFFAPSYRVIFIILVVSGLGTGCLFPSTVKAIILWFSPRERATVMGFNQSAMNVAGIIGAGLLPTIAITMDWKYGFLFVGFGALALCLCSATLYRNPPREAAPVAARDTYDSTPAKPSTTRLTIELFKSRDIWMLSLAGFFLCTVQFATITHLVLYLEESLFFSTVTCSLVR